MLAIRDARLFLQLKKTVQVYTDVTRPVLPTIFTPSTIHLPQQKGIHLKSVLRASPVIENLRPVGLLERFFKKTGLLDVQKYRNMALAYTVYEDVIKQIDFSFFYKHFNMNDTFFSWFLVMELHVWMIMVRYMAEGTTGKFIRNNVVSAMWEDTNARIDNLGYIRSKLKQSQVLELSQQFNAAIIGYDEGLQSDDKVLAGTLWRRFFILESNNPEHLETLLIYVRKQICLFDNLPSHEIMKKSIFKLIDIKDLCKYQ